jgi:hypothetical protein
MSANPFSEKERAKMVKLRFRPSIRELVSIARTDRTTRVSYSPFGDVGGSLYAAGAAPWKLTRKAPGEGLAEYLRRLEQISAGVASGLSSAIRISVDAAGRTGVTLAQMASGAVRVMPTKAFAQSLGRPTEVRSKDGRMVYRDRAVTPLAQARSYSAILPTVRAIAPTPTA